MIFEEQKRKGAFGYTAYSIKFLRDDKSKYGPSIYTDVDPTNCKLSYIHGIGNLSGYTDEEKREVLDHALKRCRGYCIINTTQKSVYEFIRDNYQTYYHHAVPVGYGGGFQYNICIRNTVNPNSNCKKPKAVATNDIEANLRKILKAKRRKADYVEEFINSIK